MDNIENYGMKKLLILGGQQKLCDIVNKAREMGVYTVVTDWYENSPAKRIADKYYDVSTSDVDAILQLIRDEQIDGVITGYIDSTLPYYYEICRRAEFPCYLNEKTLTYCTNKLRFKEICSEAGIKTIPTVDVSGDLSEVEYPVLIKPADSSGSKGITVCYNKDMIPKAVERAKRFSKSKSYVAEKFMNCDYVAAYYIVRNGKAMLSLLMDKDMNHIGRGAIPYPTAYAAPSRYHDVYIEKIDPKVQKLVQKLEMENGVFLISFFINGENYYAVEPAARLTATREYVITGDAHGIDPLEMHINHALTGNFEMTSKNSEPEISSAYNGSIYCMLLFFVKEGIIGKIEGIDQIKALPGVLDYVQYRDIGAKIRADGSYGQLFFRVYLKADEVSELISQVNTIENLLQVYSEDNKPMVMAGFDAARFLG